MSTQCPRCGWFYSATYKPVGSMCENTAHLPRDYKAELIRLGAVLPACQGIVQTVKKTLDSGGAKS